MDKETIKLLEAVLPNLAVVLSLTALYIANKVKNTVAVKKLTEGEIGFWFSLFIEVAEHIFGRASGDAKKAYVKERVKGVGIDFSDENLDLAIDKTVEKLTEAGVINAHTKE